MVSMVTIYVAAVVTTTGIEGAVPKMELAPLLFGVVSQGAAAIILSSMGAIFMAWLAIKTQRQIASSRLVFETLNQNNWDKDYIEKRSKFIKLRDSDDAGLAQFASSTVIDSSTDEMATIRAILSDYENMAIGVRQGILDEQYLYRFLRGTAVKDWACCSPFIAGVRRQFGNQQLYVEFEGLATQWTQNLSYYRQGAKMPERLRIVKVK